MLDKKNLEDTRTVTEIMADYISRIIIDDLPEDVVKIATDQILNSVCNMIGGQRLKSSRIVTELFEEFGGSSQATVLVSGHRLPLIHTLYVNGYSANALDYDDSYMGDGFGGHPGSAIIPAALALAEHLEATGKELVASVVIGYEVALRIGAAIAPSKARKAQVWPLATWQSLGAAAAAASLLHLNREKTRHALGLAGISMPVPAGKKWGEAKDEEGPVSWAKNNFGWASMGAVLGAILSDRGFWGNRQIFDGDRGFWVMAGSDRWQPDKLVNGFGKEYLILKTCIKKYPACWWAQSALEAIEELKRKHNITPEVIEYVNVDTIHDAVYNLSKFSPESPIDVQFSIPYLIALELSNHSLLDVTEEVLLDKEVQLIAQKVRVREATAAEEAYPKKTLAEVCVKFEGKEAVCKTVDIPKGDFRRPLTQEELENKCFGLLEPFFSREKAERIIRDVSHIADCTNVRRLVDGWYSS